MFTPLDEAINKRGVGNENIKVIDLGDEQR